MRRSSGRGTRKGLARWIFAKVSAPSALNPFFRVVSWVTPLTITGEPVTTHRGKLLAVNALESSAFSRAEPARQKRIRSPLPPNGGDRPVAGINFHIVTERQKFIEKRIHQLLSRAPGQISSAN